MCVVFIVVAGFDLCVCVERALHCQDDAIKRNVRIRLSLLMSLYLYLCSLCEYMCFHFWETALCRSLV